MSRPAAVLKDLSSHEFKKGVLLKYDSTERSSRIINAMSSLISSSRIIWVLILTLAGTGAYSLAADGNETLTLDQAISIAVAHNRKLQGAALGIKKASDKVAEARTQRLPQLSAFAMGGELLSHPSITFNQGALGNVNGSPVPSQITSINLPNRPTAFVFSQANLPLTPQYRLGLNVRRLQAEREFQRESLRDTRAEVTSQVREVYYRLLLAKSGLESVSRQREMYQESERVTMQYVSHKTALRSDLLDVQSRAARSEYELAVLRDQIASDKERMNQLLGRALETEFDVTPLDEISWPTLDVAEVRETALRSNPGLRKARLRLQESHLESRMKKSEYLPDISLNVSYASALGVSNLIPTSFGTAGFLATWEPFDWGRKRHEASELAAASAQNDLDVKDAEEHIRIECGKIVRQFYEARQLVAASRLAEQQAQENLRVVQLRYEQDVMFLRNVLEAQSIYAAASEQTQRALAGVWGALSDLDKITGGER